VTGEMIAARRRELQMTQQALADESGIERYNIGKIETGTRDVSPTELAFIADALNVAPEALLRQQQPAVMFRHNRPESEGAAEAIRWFEGYVEQSAIMKALEDDLAAHR
jgi:transcriptional regulator with XRE-family HTH domain